METASISRAKKAAAAVNQIKATGNEFLTEDLIIQLRKNGCPYPKTLPRILEKLEIVKKSKGITTFLHPEPVFYGLLVAELDKSSENCMKYTTKSLKKKKGISTKELLFDKAMVVLQTTEDPIYLASADTNRLIEELKKRGDFIIQEKVTQLITW